MLNENTVTTIDGANFGSSQGHLYVRAQSATAFLELDNAGGPPPIEIKKESISEWKRGFRREICLVFSCQFSITRGKIQIGARDDWRPRFGIPGGDGNRRSIAMDSYYYLAVSSSLGEYFRCRPTLT